MRVTVPSPCLGCFNVVLPALRLNIPLIVSSSNLGGLVSIPVGDSISRGQVLKASVTSRTPLLFGPAYRTPKAILSPLFHRLMSRMSPGLGKQWNTATALFPSLADTAPVAIVSSWAPRTLVGPNFHSSCSSCSIRPALSSKQAGYF